MVFLAPSHLSIPILLIENLKNISIWDEFVIHVKQINSKVKVIITSAPRKGISCARSSKIIANTKKNTPFDISPDAR
jgi:hypothetical protein